MAKYSIDEVSSLLAGAKVVKNYGNLQELFVVGIERNKKPTDVMDKVTFEQYYLTKYNIQIKDLSQPLVIASRRKRVYTDRKKSGENWKEEEDEFRFMFEISSKMEKIW